MTLVGERLLRWSVVGALVAWGAYVVLIVVAAEVPFPYVDVAWSMALLAPLPFPYSRPGPLSGAVAVAAVWLLGALTVTGMVVVPFVTIAEALLVVAWIARKRSGEDTSTRGPV